MALNYGRLFIARHHTRNIYRTHQNISDLSGWVSIEFDYRWPLLKYNEVGIAHYLDIGYWCDYRDGDPLGWSGREWSWPTQFQYDRIMGGEHG